MIMDVHRDKTDQLDILDIALKSIGENSRRKVFLVVIKLLVMYLKCVAN